MVVENSNETPLAVQPGGEAHYDEDRRRGGIAVAIVVALLVLWWILTQTTIVPDLRGLTEVEARRTLREASLRPGTVTEVKSIEHPAGQVAGQSPYSGIRILKGSEIDFQCSEGAGPGVRVTATGEPEPVGYALALDDIESGSTLRDQTTVRTTYVARAVPMVQAMTENEAVAALTSAGYRVTVKYGPVTTGPGKGRVFFQDPEPDAVESAGTLVEIWVSTGGVAPGSAAHPTPVVSDP